MTGTLIFSDNNRIILYLKLIIFKIWDIETNLSLNIIFIQTTHCDLKKKKIMKILKCDVLKIKLKHINN